MIWFLLFLAVLGIAWFLFVPRAGDETALPVDGDRSDDDLPYVSAHATSTVEPTLTHPAALFTADGTEMPAGRAGTDGSQAASPAVSQDAVQAAAPDAVQKAASDAAQYAASDAAQSATFDAAQSATSDAAQYAASGAAQEAASDTAQEAARAAAQDSSGDGAPKVAELGWMPENYQEPRWDNQPGSFE